MDAHTDTAAVEAPVAEVTSAVESLPSEESVESSQSFMEAIDQALSPQAVTPQAEEPVAEEAPQEPVEEPKEEPVEEPKEESTEEETQTEESNDNYDAAEVYGDGLASVLEEVGIDPQVISNTFKESKVIAIDEAHFFSDLLKFVKYAEKFNKIIIVSGLDGDYKREPIGDILKLIPLCDDVVKLKALDMVDNDGTEAIFSKRIVDGDQQILVGAQESYIAVSRKNYIHT